MALARFAGQGHDLEGLVKTAAKAGLITGVLTALICGLSLPFLLPQDKHNLLPSAYLFLLFIPLNHLALNLQGVDHGVGNFRWLNVTRALLYPIFFTGVLLCWWLATDMVFWVAASLLVGNGSVVAVRLVPKLRSLFRRKQGVPFKTLYKESYPFVVASIIAILYAQMDKALLVWLLAPEEIGWYVAAFAAAGSVNVLNSALGIVHFSTAAQAKPRLGFAQLAGLLRRGGLLSFAGGSMLALALPWLVPLVYGNDFRPATAMALLLLPGLVLAGLGDIINQALRGQGQPVAGVVSKILGLIVMGVVGAVLSHFFAGRGIACGYLAGELVAFVGILFVAMRYYHDTTWDELRPSSEDVVYLQAYVFKRKGTVK